MMVFILVYTAIIPVLLSFSRSYRYRTIMVRFHGQGRLRVREVPGSIPNHGPRHTKDVIKMVAVIPLFSTEHSIGKKYWLFLKN